MNRFRKITKTSTSKLKSILPPVTLIIGNIFLFGPVTVYSGNIMEFDVSLINILANYVIPSIIISAIFLGIGICLSGKYLSLYVSLLTGIGLLLWLQGNILVWNIGQFGKGDINFAANSWMGWVDGAIWSILLILAVLFHRKISKMRTFLIFVLLFLQSGYLIFMSIQKPEIWKAKSSLKLSPPREIYEFSSNQNIIHVILDEFQSTVFKEIINKDTDLYYSTLEGFTFFKETTGSFPTTVMSIPALVSGKIYTNHAPILNFLNSVYPGETIANTLHENGYDVDITASAGSHWLRKGRFSTYFHIPVPYGGTKQQHYQQNAVLILRFALFRHVPHFLKKAVYNNQYLPIPHKKDRKHFEAARHFAAKAFLQDLIDNVSITRTEPVYKFFHLPTTHFPAVLDDNCEYAGRILTWNWENIKVQAKCSFDHFAEFLRKLKALGIYDSSFIILHADHGYWKVRDSVKQIDIKNEGKVLEEYGYDSKEYFAQIVCSALPLLAVKLPHSKGPLKISNAPVALTDIPATIYTVLNLPAKFNGRSVFDINKNETRERKFYYYDTLNRQGDDYFSRLDEFIIKGNPLDKTSWTFLSHLVSKPLFQISQIDLGTGKAKPFLFSGWSSHGGSSNGITYRWALGNIASLRGSLPKNKTVFLTAKVLTLPFHPPQTITAKVDGKEAGFWKLSPSSWNRKIPWSWDTHSVEIAPEEQRPDISVVEFIFSQYKKPDKKDKRALAVLFNSIVIEVAQDN